MRLKKGVEVVHQDTGLSIQPEAVMAVIVADVIWKLFNQELVVTSVLEGKHKVDSLHYTGNAVDFRTRYFTDEEKSLVYALLKKVLLNIDSDYDVIFEETHIHVEYDPR